MIELGTKVRDIVSNFRGIATARAEYRFCTPRIQVSPDRIDSDGKLIEPVWFEEAQLTQLDKDASLGFIK